MATYEAKIESLKQYETPQWYKDAKLGIYTHWGPYAVPAFNSEWYPRHMYEAGNMVAAHHRRNWGAQSEFGYKDFIPMFTAENWDPEEWAALFSRAGARFAGPVAEHHDGFAMYDCAFTDWNAVKMGPRRDVTAEQKKAFEAVGMKFIATSHRAANARHFTVMPGSDRMDPAYEGLYWKPYAHRDDPIDEEFLDDWIGRTKEIVDRYQPDVLWFDFGWHRPEFTPYRFALVAYYYNRAEEWGKEVVMNYKDHLFDGAGVFNVERGRLAGIRDEYWQTDTSVSYRSWCFVENDHFKSATKLVHDLVDIVSKNGNLLLNFGPRPDGTIPEEVKGLLLAQGRWLELNGEAIYATRCWDRYGEGPTPTGRAFKEADDPPYTPRDWRFTVRRNAESDSVETLYAIALGWPGRRGTITTLASGGPIAAAQIARLEMLGIEGELPWEQDHEGLHVTMPDRRPCDHAYTVKITLKA